MMCLRPNWLLPAIGLTIGLLALVLLSHPLEQTQQVSDPARVVLFNARIIRMVDESVLTQHAVIVEGDRIVEIRPIDEIPHLDDAVYIDCDGGYLIPGLADMHMHTWTDWLETEEYAVNPLSLYLAKGVTTIRCLGPGGKDPEHALDLQAAIAAGDHVGPTIYTSGEVLNSPLSNPSAAVRSQDRRGFDFIKPYSYLTRTDLQAILTEAERRGLYSVGHLPYSVSLEEALAMGLDEVAHIEELAWELINFDRDQELTADEWSAYVMEMVMTQHADALTLPPAQLADRYGRRLREIADQLIAANAAVCTTLVVGDTIATKLLDPLAFLARPGTSYLSNSFVQRFLDGHGKHQLQLRGLESLAQFKRSLEAVIVQEMHQAGVRLVAGTDAGTGVLGVPAGFALHDELKLLVAYGLTPYEALSSCTRTAGEVANQMVGVQDFGLLKPGLRADLVLLAENPLDSLDALDNIRGVMFAGQWLGEPELEQMLRIPEGAEPVQLHSSWRDQPVVLDGRISSDSEWSNAAGLDLHLLESNTGPESIPSTWWMMNDKDWLYVLVCFPAQSPTISAATIAYFWPYPFPTQASDYTWIDSQGETWDACSFDFETWRWRSDSLQSAKGADQIEGASMRAQGSRWFEFRKPLDSQDSSDWSLLPGQCVGVRRTGPLNLGAISSGAYYEQGILLHLAEDPLMAGEQIEEVK